MSQVVITVPQQYGRDCNYYIRYVILVASGTLFTSIWLGVRVSSFRKAAKVPYPVQSATSSMDAQHKNTGALAKEEYLFNCAQRAHGNMLECLPEILSGMLLTGLRYPIFSASVGSAWVLSRILYGLGYTDPTKTKGESRLIGSIISYATRLLFFGATAYMGFSVAMGN